MNDKPIERVLDKLEGVRPGAKPNRWTALCPAHEDTKHSLGVAVGTDDKVIVRCYAGCGFASIASALGLAPADFFKGRTKPRVEIDRGVTLQALAFDKRIPEEALAGFGLSDVRNGSKCEVRIPYRDETGAPLFERVRTAKSAKAGTRQPPGTALVPYGLWRLSEARKGKRLILVEGESDCWTLWHNGYHALGIPGASAAKSLTPDFLRGFEEIVLWEEPDAAGGNLKADLIKSLSASGIAFKVASAPKVKDPCDLHAADPAGFRAAFDAILAAAVPATAATTSLPSPPRSVSSRGGRPLTDLGNAERLIDMHGPDLRRSAAHGGWLVWDGVRWCPDDTGEAMRRMVSTVRDIYREAAAAEDSERRNRIVSHAIASEGRARIRAAVDLAQSLPGVPVRASELDSHPMLFNCANGTIDLHTGELREHRRDDLISQLSPVAYDPAAKCPLWERTLGTVLPADDVREYVQRLYGYCLTGHVSEQTLPIFHGGGANGKSVILTVLSAVLGDYAMNAPPGFLMAARGERHPTETADMFGRRVVLASETGAGCKLDEALVKQLTGGERIRARKMRQDFFEFAPTHKLILSTNHRPRVSNGDHGIWRRLALVPFDVTFWNPDKGEAGPDHLRQDKALAAKLLAELPGILAWAVRGCLAWQRDGLGAPAAVAKATADYREEEDTVAAFLSADDVHTGGGGELLGRVYEAFARYCDGRPTLTKRALSAELQRRGFAVEKGTANRTYVRGLRLIQAPCRLADLDD